MVYFLQFLNFFCHRVYDGEIKNLNFIYSKKLYAFGGFDPGIGSL